MICFQCTRTVGYRRRDFLCDECREAVEPYYAITDEELRAARVLYDRTPRRLSPFWYGFAWLLAFLWAWGIGSWLWGL